MEGGVLGRSGDAAEVLAGHKRRTRPYTRAHRTLVFVNYFLEMYLNYYRL